MVSVCEGLFCKSWDCHITWHVVNYQVPWALPSEHARQSPSVVSEAAQVLCPQCTQAPSTEGSEEKVSLLELLLNVNGCDVGRILMSKVYCVNVLATMDMLTRASSGLVQMWPVWCMFFTLLITWIENFRQIGIIAKGEEGKSLLTEDWFDHFGKMDTFPFEGAYLFVR